MQIEFIPQTPAQWFGLTIATLLAVISGWWARRRREPVEIAKLKADAAKTHAETRQINTSTDLSLIQACMQAIAKAERLQQERDHWEQKASDAIVDLADLRTECAQMETRLSLREHDVKKMKALLDFHNISFAELDKPKGNGK